MPSCTCLMFWNSTMRLNIYDQFVVGVVRPDGGWSKGRPIAYIEDKDKCVPLFGVLIPNDLDDEAMARYVGNLFCAFAQTGKRVELLHSTPTSPFAWRQRNRKRRVAHRHSTG
jgi:hypothetical protein